MANTNMVLIGMPGAGKSTAGVLLAKALRRPFLDTDLLIQTREDRYLQEIINRDGIETFLDIEARAICSLDVEHFVIATGGSVVYRPRAMAHLQANGLVLYLAYGYDTIAQRLTNITTRGVVRHPAQSLRDLYQERQPLYAHYADVTIDAEGLTLEETVACLAEMLREREHC